MFVMGKKRDNVSAKPHYWPIDRNLGANCSRFLLTPSVIFHISPFS